MGLGSVFVRILFAVTLAERGRRGKIVVERRGEGGKIVVERRREGRRGADHGHSGAAACERGQGCQRRWAGQGGTGGSPQQLCPSGIRAGTGQESCSLPAESPECSLPRRRKGSRAAQPGSSSPGPAFWGAGLLLPASLGCSDCRRL